MNSKVSNGNCLHLVVKSSSDALQHCYSQFDAGDTVLFLDDGVMQAAINADRVFKPIFRNSFFSATDLAARGLRKLADEKGLRVLNDPEFLELLQKHDFCLTWK